MKTIDSSNVKKVLLLALFYLVSGNLSAAEAAKEDNRNPIGCRDNGYEFDMNILRLVSHSVGAKQSLYFLYNTSAQNVTLYQMRGEESSRGMYLNHTINAGQWAVLSTSEKKLKYICAIPDGKTAYGKIVECAQTLRVCEYNNVKYGMNNQGNYWLVNSNSRNGAVNAVVHYGIIPGV
jgi:hypothetical protein